MANIGNLSVILSSNADAFSKGLEKASRYIDKFGSSAAHMKNAVGAPFQSIAEKAKDLLTAIPVVGAAFAVLPTSASGFLSWLREGMAEISSLTKEALRLNIATEALAGLQLLAGSSAESLEKGLFKLSKQLGDAASGGEEARRTFAGLGLNAGELAAIPLDQALARISDRFLSLASPAERAYLAFALFGKSGYELLPILARGSASIEQMIERAKGLGLAFDQLDAAKVLRAERAFRQLDSAMKGIQRQAAIAFAPILGPIAEEFDKIFAKEDGFRDFWQKLAEYTATGAAFILEKVGELVNAVKAEFAELKAFMHDPTGLKGALSDPRGLGAIAAPGAFAPLLFGNRKDESKEGNKEANPFADIINKLRDPNAWGSAATALFKKFGDASLGASRDAAELAAQQQKLVESVVELEESLRGQVETFGRGAEAAKIWKLEQQGATDVMLKEARALLAQEDALKAMDALKKGAAEMAKELVTPLETFESKIEELQEYLQAGLIDTEMYARGAAKAFDTLAGKDIATKPQSPAALTAGSSAAISAVTQATVRGQDSSGRTDPMRRVVDVLNQALGVQRTEADYARQTAQAIDNIFVMDF